jgi:DNA-binding response OmpR family regulator
MGRTVLVVEDDPDTTELVGMYLRRDGHKVLSERDGRDGLRTAIEARPDIIVLDLMLPGMDGIEVCRAVRRELDVPILMLTARADEQDRLIGLDLGADDYVTKPFSPRELAARVRAVLRRSSSSDDEHDGPAELVYGEVTADLRSQIASVAGVSISLTPTEFKLLTFFMGTPGRVFSRERIIDQVFGYDFAGFDRTVDAHISAVRRKLHSKKDGRRYLHTVYGVGYRFGDA